MRMERSCPDTHAYQIWKQYLKGHSRYEPFSNRSRRFWNLNADPKIKNCMRMERCCPDTHAYQIWKQYLKGHSRYEPFSNRGRRFQNLKTDPKFKVNVTGVKNFMRMDRCCLDTHAYQIWKQYLKGHSSYEPFSNRGHRFRNLKTDPKLKVKGKKLYANG
jgi:hypothetical protein